jgi:molybdopterin converting factor small subunit
MAGRRRHGPRPDRHTALLLAGPLAIAGAIGGAWGGSTLLAHPTVRGADATTMAAHLDGGQRGDMTPIVVRVRVSGPLQSQLGRDSITVTLPGGGTVGTLLNQLGAEDPVIAAMGPSVMIAVSGSMATPDAVIVAGETVELMSPMAGG